MDEQAADLDMRQAARERRLADDGGTLSRSPASVLNGALLDSRQRWRDLAALSADFAFETDGAGHIVFAAPDHILGWQAAALLGQPACGLLATADGFNPFAVQPAYRARRVWLRRADGSQACLAFSAAPLLQDGAITGMRGCMHDVTVQDERDARVAASLRRGEVVDHILRRMRQEVMAQRMMQAVLDGLAAALGSAGAAVLNLLAEPGDGAVLHKATDAPVPHGAELLAGLQAETPDPVVVPVSGWSVLACPSYTRFGERTGLCVWRPDGDTPWTEDDGLLVSSVTAIVRVVLEHEAIQRELARQARTDPLTGLLNRRSFLEEVSRRIDRLDREDLPATLMYVDLDHFKRLNDACGHDVGDVALVRTAELLRSAVRPSDLVARLGGDEFAMWLDGSDELTAAERAERLRLDAPSLLATNLPAGAPALSTSIGIASRQPRGGEALDDLMRRADAAMYSVKRAGRGHWRVAPDPMIA